ncbi:ComEC/Rec2 family competence protein [Thermocoleostomius sinensis]|uniref:ComEC/Rec2 family competence protein n=1 Tax=Thermocoleostomius sinensis A174 TaxID=2016057 RepID=A0A9E8ZC35_9CYAN|nr:ComEC/Rec2 family competence protein [Thermocoleostomius sinensis]WAL60112.1 ComEC/Rec2 family competence protein [Thermocoleostomius sinensis A174]
MATSAAVICLAYILGLLLTGIPGKVANIPIGAIGLLVIGVVVAFLVPRFWRMGPRSRVWLVAAVIGVLASLYFQARIPRPTATDISHLFLSSNATTEILPRQLYQVQGTIATSPRLTQSQRIQFELEATQAQAIDPPNSSPRPVTGRVLVTVPPLQATGLYPGQRVTIAGSLYQPKPATNPGGFDFAKYLAQQGIFTGLRGQTVTVTAPHLPPPLWSIRQRIIRSQVAGLGVPEGPLVSAMVMGGRSVDLPYEMRDQFRWAGLAHALAASGAQVSLLVGIVLTCTQRLQPNLRLGLGLSVLLFYLSLTGIEASVLRAAIMGTVALVALTVERKVNPIASILFAATLLLLWNPLWMFDLGFQLSFLATLGLLVTVPVLSQWLDWLPALLIPLFTVPIAAFLWTLPLLLFAFGITSPYSVLINIVATPLIAVISVGGMISAVAALIYPSAGSVLAGLLHLPSYLFIQLAEWGNQLPGNTWAVGSISIVRLLLLYGLMGLIWAWKAAQRYWWIALIVGMSLILIPAWYTSTTLLQATVLDTTDRPVLVWQEQGQVALINSGSETDAKFTVLPFLLKQGVNRIDWAVSPSLQSVDREGWQRLQSHLAIQAMYAAAPSASLPGTSIAPLAFDRPMQLGAATVRSLGHNTSETASALVLDMAGQRWLFLNHLPAVNQQVQLPSASVLWWTGEELSAEILAAINPTVAIVSGRTIAPSADRWLQAHSVTTFVTDRDGAVQWTPQRGFRSQLEAVD